MTIKGILKPVLFVGGVVALTTGAVKWADDSSVKESRQFVRDSYNLTTQEFAKIDKSISNSGKDSWCKTISWKQAIDSLERRNASLDVAVKQKMLQVGDSLAKIMKNVKVK